MIIDVLRTSLSVVFYFLLSCSLSYGDDMRPASLHINSLDKDLYEVLWKVPAKEGRLRLKLGIAFDDSVQKQSPVKTRFVADAYLESWTISHPNKLDGVKLTISGLDSTYTDVIIRYTNAEAETLTEVLSASTPEYTFDHTAETSSVAANYFVLGIEHILKGWDHLLFVACLVFIAGTRRKLLLTITGFTLAHSLTLILASLDIVKVPIPPVEAVIALSILFLAVEIAHNRENSLSLRYPVLVSSSFGLLHGFGFAAVLDDIGLPPGEAVSALLFFNVGVEAGQLIFVAGLLIFFWLVVRLLPKIQHHHVRQCVSYASGSIASFWLISRLLAF